MMHRLLAKMDQNQAKADENQEKTDAHQAKMEANLARMEAERKSDAEKLKSWMEKRMEGRLEAEGPASVDTKPEVVREQDVSLEANLEKIESKPGEAEAVVERQETPNEKV
jgi:hypothetical protein